MRTIKNITLTLLLITIFQYLATAQETGRRWDSLIVCSRIFQATYISVPMIGRGAVAKKHNEEFAQLRNEFAPKFSHTLDNYTQYLPLVSTYAMKAFGLECNSTWGQLGTSTSFSWLLMAGMVNSLKYSVKEMRPDGSKDNSFPSGHTASAFMSATILHKEYGDRYPWMSACAYTFATGTGLMRVLNNRHWIGDVMAGAGFGVLSTELGYWLSDIIFHKRKRGDTYEFWRDYVPNKPSFIGLYTGFSLPLSDYDVSEIQEYSTSTGSSIGLEGAKFFNHWLGIGGRLTFNGIYYYIPDGTTPTTGTFSYGILTTGIYGNVTLYRHLHAGGRLTGGFLHYPKEKEKHVSVASKSTCCMNFGLSCGIEVGPRLNIDFNTDYYLLSPHSNYSHERMSVLSFGCTTSILLWKK